MLWIASVSDPRHRDEQAERPHVREMVLRDPVRCTIPGAALMVVEQTFITSPPSRSGDDGDGDDADDSDGAAR